jgi:signal transduction histidine kinase
MTLSLDKPAPDDLLHRERLAMMGELAAGIAHEINNPLAFICSNLATLEQYARTVSGTFAQLERYVAATRADASPAAQQILADLGYPDCLDDLHYILADLTDLTHESLVGARRATEIIGGLKRFARLDPAAAAELDVHDVLESALTLVRNELRYRCDVLKDYAELPRIHGLAPQLSQVFMNLIVNAAQSMTDRGTLTLTTRAHGDEVSVCIADTGHGMSAAAKAQLFTPFASSREGGSGMGLGLAISQAIVTKHGGRIQVESEPGVGSQFTVYLPLQPPARAAVPAQH